MSVVSATGRRPIWPNGWRSRVSRLTPSRRGSSIPAFRWPSNWHACMRLRLRRSSATRTEIKCARSSMNSVVLPIMQLWQGYNGMGKSEEIPGEKGNEILRQMREDTGSKKHLDQRKLRAKAALRRAVEERDEQTFLAALTELGIDPESKVGRAYLQDLRQLPADRYY